MRVCWNRQTGTFEVRVSMTCGFKSHRSHHQTESGRNLRSGLSFFILLFARVYGDIYFVIASQWRASIRGPCMKLSFLLFYFHMGHRYLFDSVECIGIKAKFGTQK